jgi:hypothetical protein
MLDAALVTTTIQVPRLLELHRAIAAAIPIYVVGDLQSPDDEINSLCAELGNAYYYSAADQARLGYESSEVLGWRCPGRRSIGFLEAVRHGADVIVSIDDDNLPMDDRYFEQFLSVLAVPFSGLQVTAPTGWVDPGDFLDPPVRHRGFPHELWHDRPPVSLGYQVGRRVGVAAGLWLGDPDTDAVSRMATRPRCLGASPACLAGFVADNNCFAPFNSQNVAFVRELLPLMVMHSGVGRYDDIWASFIAQRVMREFEMVVHYGQPLVWQDRNDHDPVSDLAAELFGLRNTMEFTRYLNSIQLPRTSIVEAATELYRSLRPTKWSSAGIVDLGEAWLRDAIRVLA